MSILIFIAVLFALVLVHEWGHFFVAKKTGMRVDEFGIGFPPKLFGIKKGETLYSINALPIGGFVKIFGEDAVVGEGETSQSGSFTSKSKWAQTAVLVAGVGMNILFAWFLFVIALSVGVESAVSEAEAGPDARLIVSQVLPDSPAALAKIPTGAIITSVQDSEGNTPSALFPSAFSEFATSHGTEMLTITYQVGDEMFLTTLSPKQGIIASDPERAAIGVQLTTIEVVREPFHKAITKGFMLTVTSLKEITVGMWGLLRDAVTLKADLTNVAGPVGIVGMVGEASALGVTSLVMFTAFISLNLAVINLLPFPALDGGRLLFVIIEAVKRSPINPRYVMILNTVGFMMLMALMAAITWNDIAKII